MRLLATLSETRIVVTLVEEEEAVCSERRRDVVVVDTAGGMAAEEEREGDAHAAELRSYVPSNRISACELAQACSVLG